jgi:hypothetical protein
MRTRLSLPVAAALAGAWVQHPTQAAAPCAFTPALAVRARLAYIGMQYAR